MTEIKKPILSKEETEIADDCTTFVLAGCMISCYSLMASKNFQAVSDFMMKVGTILSRDPAYIKRFQAKQDKIITVYKEMMAEADSGKLILNQSKIILPS